MWINNVVEDENNIVYNTEKQMTIHNIDAYSPSIMIGKWTINTGLMKRWEKVGR